MVFFHNWMFIFIFCSLVLECLLLLKWLDLLFLSILIRIFGVIVFILSFLFAYWLIAMPLKRIRRNILVITTISKFCLFGNFMCLKLTFFDFRLNMLPGFDKFFDKLLLLFNRTKRKKQINLKLIFRLIVLHDSIIVKQ